MSTATSDLKTRVEAANTAALARLVSADPVLVDVAPAAEVVEGLEGRMILHAGHPFRGSGCAGPCAGL
ncbi:MAG TPA: hypothetical protein VNF91_03665 [Candidatus Acidoferrum sp.]|nr:hypothetical protein [Candidatus Acidoferrum sp.]